MLKRKLIPMQPSPIAETSRLLFPPWNAASRSLIRPKFTDRSRTKNSWVMPSLRFAGRL